MKRRAKRSLRKAIPSARLIFIAALRVVCPQPFSFLPTPTPLRSLNPRGSYFVLAMDENRKSVNRLLFAHLFASLPRCPNAWNRLLHEITQLWAVATRWELGNAEIHNSKTGNTNFIDDKNGLILEIINTPQISVKT